MFIARKIISIFVKKYSFSRLLDQHVKLIRSNPEPFPKTTKDKLGFSPATASCQNSAGIQLISILKEAWSYYLQEFNSVVISVF